VKFIVGIPKQNVVDRNEHFLVLFECLYGQEFSLFHVVETGSGAFRASYPMDTGKRGLFPQEQSGRDVKLITQLELALR
jgi:hypothetical protein